MISQLTGAGRQVVQMSTLLSVAAALLAPLPFFFAGSPMRGLALGAGFAVGAAGNAMLPFVVRRAGAMGPGGFGLLSLVKLGFLTSVVLTLGVITGRSYLPYEIVGLGVSQLLLSATAAVISVRAR